MPAALPFRFDFSPTRIQTLRSQVLNTFFHTYRKKVQSPRLASTLRHPPVFASPAQILRRAERGNKGRAAYPVLSYLNTAAERLPAVELEVDRRVRQRPGFQEEEELGLEIVPVAAVGDDDGAISAAVDLGPIPS